jgi:hypothetical protein
MSTITKMIFAILFLLALVILGPLLTIWSLNTLFPVLAIPYNIETWIAIIIIVGAIKSTVNIKK